ncbi:MAG: hypothetical protein H8E25_05615 [Planctomycetes bacterium]|nr:hypothetical protein [Planctomycetota bacterium]
MSSSHPLHDLFGQGVSTPQFGQTTAESEISLLHSLQGLSAIIVIIALRFQQT